MNLYKFLSSNMIVLDVCVVTVAILPHICGFGIEPPTHGFSLLISLFLSRYFQFLTSVSNAV